MKKTFDFFAVLFLFCFIFASAFAQNDIDDVYGQLKAKYKSIKAVSLNFKRSSDKIAGSLKAKTGNKYYLEFKDRTIVCNGTTIWNYSRKDKSVVINNYEESTSQVKIEEIFFTFLNKYKPSDLKTEQSSQGLSAYVLLMKPEEASESNKDIKLHIDKEKFNIVSLEINNDGNWEVWEIDKLNTKKHSDKSFDFTPPDNTNIIDLR